MRRTVKAMRREREKLTEAYNILDKDSDEIERRSAAEDVMNAFGVGGLIPSVARGINLAKLDDLIDARDERVGQKVSKELLDKYGSEAMRELEKSDARREGAAKVATLLSMAGVGAMILVPTLSDLKKR